MIKKINAIKNFTKNNEKQQSFISLIFTMWIHVSDDRPVQTKYILKLLD